MPVSGAPLAVNRFDWPMAPRLRRDGHHFIWWLINSVTPVCGIRLRISQILLWARPGSLLPTSWTHASRNAQSLIKLARQNHYGHGDGRLDRQFRRLGHRRHLQGFWTVDLGQGRPHRDLDRAVPPDLHRATAADRPPVWSPFDHGAG